MATTTSSPTTTDITLAITQRMTTILKAGLTPAAYDEYGRLEGMLEIINRLMAELRDTPPVLAPPVVAAPSQNGRVKTYGGTPTHRERVRAYLATHGPTKLVDILRETGVPRGTIGGVLLRREFVKVKHGVWKLRGGK